MTSFSRHFANSIASIARCMLVSACFSAAAFPANANRLVHIWS